MQQVKFASVQRTHSTITSPQELMDAIPEARIMKNQVIWPLPGKTGTYQFSAKAFDQIPLFDWASIFHKSFLQTPGSIHPLGASPHPTLPGGLRPQLSGASRSCGASWEDVSPSGGATPEDELFEC